jgi:hypothetical protein
VDDLKGIDDALRAGVQPTVLSEVDSARFIDQVEALSRRAEPWERPVPFDEPRLPGFPMESYPKWLGDYLSALARFTETPPELAGMIGLAIVGTCLARAFRIEVKPSYHEPLNIWACAILEPGNRKTAVVNGCTAPVLEWQAEQKEKLEPAILRAESERKSQEALISSMRGKLKADAPDQTELIRQIQELELKRPQVPRLPQIWASDTTPEQLGIILSENHERMAILSDEGGIFDILAGRYSKGIPNLDLFLKAHSGSPERIDRASRPAVYLRAPALTVGISPQPAVVQKLAGIDGFRGRGLLARFLYALPVSLLGFRSCDPDPLPAPLESCYRRNIRWLLEQAHPKDATELAPLRTIRLSPDALGAWKSFSKELEPKLKKDDGELYSVRDWAAKLPGAAARVAGLLHICGSAGDPEPSETVSFETMLRSLELIDALTPHAQAVFGLMGCDPEAEHAKAVLKWISQEAAPEFSERDCHHRFQRQFKRVDQLRPVLRVLIERHFIREAPLRPGPGRPSTRFEVNPVLLRVL